MDESGHINGQGLYPILEMAYGATTAGNTSCETIAVYNVLKDLGVSTTLSDIIFTADVNGYMLIGGCWGVAPYKVDDLMDDYGIEYDRVTQDEVERKADAGDYQSGQPFVAVIWNNEDSIFDGIHTFEITYSADEEESQWIVYNRFNDDSSFRVYDSLSDILQNGSVNGSYISVFQIDGRTYINEE